MSGLTPDMSRVKVEGGGQRKSPGKAPRHRALPRSLLKTKPDVGGITADIERLLVLDALVKPIESDMDKLIKQIKAHMAVTGETRIETCKGYVAIQSRSKTVPDHSRLSPASRAAVATLEARILLLRGKIARRDEELQTILQREGAMKQIESGALWKHPREAIKSLGKAVATMIETKYL